MHINVQGVLNKIDELSMFLNASSTDKVNIVSINEHWLGCDTIHILDSISGFQVVDYYTRTDLKRGGTALLVRSSAGYNVTPRNDLKTYNQDSVFEASIIEIENMNSLFVSLYRVPYYGTYKPFLDRLQNFLSMLATNRHKKVYIATDFNINTLAVDDAHTTGLIDKLRIHGFKLNVFEATRETDRSKTCIDNIITKYGYTCSERVTVYDIGISDHKAILFPIAADILCLKSNTKRRPTTYKRKFDGESISNFTKEFGKEKCMFDPCKSVNENYDAFIGQVLKLFTTLFPKRAVTLNRRNKSLPWITKGIKVSSQRKRLLHSLAKTSGEDSIKAYYYKYNKIFKRTVRLAKRMSNDRFIENSDCKSTATWRIIKADLGIVQKSDKIDAINIGREKIKDHKRMCNVFNSAFLDSAKNLGVSCGSQKAAKVRVDSTQRKFSFRSVTVNEVHKTILSLKNKKSSGWDEIPVILIKAANNLISPYLTKIINQSLLNGCFPEKLKYSIVRPIYKNGEKSSVVNYRPISLLSNFSKIFETIVKKQLYAFAELNIFNRSQHGFRKDHSTNSALLAVLNNVYEALDGSQKVATVSFDLSKAFDCVNHGILLNKLYAYGVRGVELDWFGSYLGERSQRTQIMNNGICFSSEWAPVRTGVPQGSVLGPLLFVVCMNDLSLHVSSEIVQFADDTTAIVRHECDSGLELNIGKVIEEVEVWCSLNKMRLNKSKTNVTKYKLRNSNMSITPSINNEKLKGEVFKLLGIFLDVRISWKPHILYLKKKLSSVCYNMRCLTHITSLKTRMVVYYGYFFSLMRYGIVLWGASGDASGLFLLQKYIVRTMMQKPRTSSCRPLFRELEILTLPSLYIYEILVNVRCNLPFYRKEGTRHRYNTRNSNLLIYPQHSTVFFEGSAFYMGLKLYNRLPKAFKDDLPLNKFKAHLRQLLVKKVYYSVPEYLGDDTLK